MSNETSTSSPPNRRVVTGRENGISKVLYDDTKGNISSAPNGTKFQTVWYTNGVPADCSAATNEDPTGAMNFKTVNDGTVCTIVCMPPGAQAPMHRTKSIDYAVVLEGEIELLLDNGDKRLLKTGDVFVQRETMHAWRNPHPTKNFKMFCVVVASNNSEIKYFEFAAS